MSDHQRDLILGALLNLVPLGQYVGVRIRPHRRSGDPQGPKLDRGSASLNYSVEGGERSEEVDMNHALNIKDDDSTSFTKDG